MCRAAAQGKGAAQALRGVGAAFWLQVCGFIMRFADTQRNYLRYGDLFLNSKKHKNVILGQVSDVVPVLVMRNYRVLESSCGFVDFNATLPKKCDVLSDMQCYIIAVLLCCSKCGARSADDLLWRFIRIMCEVLVLRTVSMRGGINGASVLKSDVCHF